MGEPGGKKTRIELKTASELESMKKAGRLAGLTLKEVGRHVEAGITTKELDDIARKFIRAGGGIPTFVGYRGYPAALCVSINEEVVHGIPGPRKIERGDVVSVDVAATLDGFVGDTAATFLVDPVSSEAEKLVRVTKKSLEAALELAVPGNRLGDISAAVQSVAEGEGFGVVRDLVGHGIGRQMHEPPAVPNYGERGTGIRLEPGLTIAIEPMITAGHWEVLFLDDGWTVVTKDGSLAAHFEHTVAVTENGPLLLTSVD